jgi:precorrin-3B C17-methyltransferase
LATVIIGNSTTFIKNGIMLTPRGYSSKYEVKLR